MRKSLATWKLPFCGLMLPALFACTRPGADQPAIGPIVEIESPATGSAGEPNLAFGRGDTIYLSWIEVLPDSSHALRFSTWKDQTIGAPRTIAAGRNWFVNWADFPMLATLPDGTLAAHWLQRSDTGRYSYNVMLTISRDGGQNWSSPVQPHRDATSGEHGFVSLFPLENQFGVVWLDGRKHAAATLAKSNGTSGVNAEMSVRFTTLSSAGELGADTEIDGRACDCCQTSVTVTSAGPLLVYRDRSAEEIRDINVMRYVNGQWTEGQPVHADQWRVDYCPVNGPSAAAQGNNVAVAWFTAARDSARVFVTFSDDAAATFAPPIRVDDGSPLGRVDVQMLGPAAALVSWLERTETGADIRVRRVSASGGAGIATTVSRSSVERASGFPHMIVSGKQVMFAWIEPGKPARLRLASAPLLQ